MSNCLTCKDQKGFWCRRALTARRTTGHDWRREGLEWIGFDVDSEVKGPSLEFSLYLTDCTQMMLTCSAPDTQHMAAVVISYDSWRQCWVWLISLCFSGHCCWITAPFVLLNESIEVLIKSWVQTVIMWLHSDGILFVFRAAVVPCPQQAATL